MAVAPQKKKFLFPFFFEIKRSSFFRTSSFPFLFFFFVFDSRRWRHRPSSQPIKKIESFQSSRPLTCEGEKNLFLLFAAHHFRLNWDRKPVPGGYQVFFFFLSLSLKENFACSTIPSLTFLSCLFLFFFSFFFYFVRVKWDMAVGEIKRRVLGCANNGRNVIPYI
jgi:hypothetical protein